MQVKTRADKLLRRVSPSYRLKRKHEDELAYWRGELTHLKNWFHDASIDWWGIRPPTPEQKVIASESWEANAVATMHLLRPSYVEELRFLFG